MSTCNPCKQTCNKYLLAILQVADLAQNTAINCQLIFLWLITKKVRVPPHSVLCAVMNFLFFVFIIFWSLWKNWLSQPLLFFKKKKDWRKNNSFCVIHKRPFPTKFSIIIIITILTHAQLWLPTLHSSGSLDLNSTCTIPWHTAATSNAKKNTNDHMTQQKLPDRLANWEERNPETHQPSTWWWCCFLANQDNLCLWATNSASTASWRLFPPSQLPLKLATYFPDPVITTARFWGRCMHTLAVLCYNNNL